jgi:hypothetical protein
MDGRLAADECVRSDGECQAGDPEDALIVRLGVFWKLLDGSLEVVCSLQQARPVLFRERTRPGCPGVSTKKLSMGVCSEVTVPELGNFCRLTVGPVGQDDFAIVLMAIPGPPLFDADAAEQI